MNAIFARAFMDARDVLYGKGAAEDADRAERQELAATVDAAMMLLSDETDFKDEDSDVVRTIKGLGRVKAHLEGGV